MTWFLRILYQKLFLSLCGSSAGAHPKNVARDMCLYGDISVLSAVSTIFGAGIVMQRISIIVLNLCVEAICRRHSSGTANMAQTTGIVRALSVNGLAAEQHIEYFVWMRPQQN